MSVRVVLPLSFLSVFALQAGCRGCNETELNADTDTGPIYWVDTGAPEETGDSGGGEETGDTSEPQPSDDWTAVSLSPGELYVGVGANVRYRLRATAPDGARATPDGVTWSVDDPAIASIDAGVATALAAGETVVRARWQGGEASALLRVEDTGHLEVTVVDTSTGAVLPGAIVQIDDGSLLEGTTDDAGLFVADGAPATPIAVCAYAEGYVSVCASNVVGRRVVLPIRPYVAAETGAVSGTADLGAFETKANEIAVGMVAAGVTEPWYLTFDDMMGDSRDVTMYGVDMQLPSNVVVGGQVEDWTFDTSPGDREVWCIATKLPLSDALSASSGSGDPITLVADHMDEARWGALSSITVTAGSTTDAGSIAPNIGLDGAVDVLTGDLPDGTAGDEVAMLLALEDRGDEWVATGLMTGLGSVTVPSVASTADSVVAMVQAGGFGSGNGLSVAWAPTGSGTVVLPEFIGIPTLPVVHVSSKTVGFDSDPEAQLVYATVKDPDDDTIDLIVAAGDPLAALPKIEGAPQFDRGKTRWWVRVLALDVSNYEEQLASGPVTRDGLVPLLTGTAYVSGQVAGTAD